MIEVFRSARINKIDPKLEESIIYTQTVICEAAMKHYLVKREDVRACPNSKCSSYGIVQLDPATGYIECTVPMQC